MRRSSISMPGRRATSEPVAMTIALPSMVSLLPSAVFTSTLPASRPPIVTKLQLHHQPRRILQNLLHPHQKRHRLAAVDEAVVVAEREIHHRTNIDFAGDRYRSLLNLVHAEDAGLRRIENRRRHQRAVDAAVRDGKGAALHLFDLERAVART